MSCNVESMAPGRLEEYKTFDLLIPVGQSKQEQPYVVIDGNTNQKIENGINEAFEYLRNEVDYQLGEHLPNVPGSGWILRGHNYLLLDMDVTSRSYAQGFIESDDIVNQSI